MRAAITVLADFHGDTQELEHHMQDLYIKNSIMYENQDDHKKF